MDIVLEGTRGARFTLVDGPVRSTIRLPLPGLYNVYNAVAAAALARTLGATPADVVAGLEGMQAAFGRAGAEVGAFFAWPGGTKISMRTRRSNGTT